MTVVSVAVEVVAVVVGTLVSVVVVELVVEDEVLEVVDDVVVSAVVETEVVSSSSPQPAAKPIVMIAAASAAPRRLKGTQAPSPFVASWRRPQWGQSLTSMPISCSQRRHSRRFSGLRSSADADGASGSTRVTGRSSSPVSRST